MYKQIRLVISLFAIISLVACDEQKQARSPNNFVSTDPSAQSTQAEMPPTSVAQIELPNECQNGTAVTILKRDGRASLCQCTDGKRVSFWGAVAPPNVPETPRDLCLSGLYYSWQIRSEPVRHLAAEAHATKDTATATSQQPTTPTPAASSGTAAPVAVAPPPPVAAVASALAKVAQQGEDNEELQIAYECNAGKAAKRSLILKGKAAGNEFQTCSGDKTACLKDRSAQRDFNSPPCLCNTGHAPREIMKNMWMCDD